MAARLALGLQKYKKPIPEPIFKPMSQQLSELLGQASNYHNAEYEKLSKQLVETNQAYSSASSADVQTQVGSEEFSLWKTYIGARLNQLPEDYLLKDEVRIRMNKSWRRMLKRDYDRIPCSQMLDLHKEFISSFQFDVPADDLCMAEMLHPHLGYLVAMPREFTFEDYLSFLNIMNLASFERFSGQELLAKQLSCFAYYNFIDIPQTGVLDWTLFKDLLATFKFPIEEESELASEFAWTPQDTPNEIAYNVYRLAFAQRIFLERNL